MPYKGKETRARFTTITTPCRWISSCSSLHVCIWGGVLVCVCVNVCVCVCVTITTPCRWMSSFRGVCLWKCVYVGWGVGEWEGSHSHGLYLRLHAIHNITEAN